MMPENEQQIDEMDMSSSELYVRALLGVELKYRVRLDSALELLRRSPVVWNDVPIPERNKGK